MRLLRALSALDPVQHLVALIDSKSRLVLARKAERILQIANDAAVSSSAGRWFQRCRRSRESAGYCGTSIVLFDPQRSLSPSGWRR